MASTPQPPDAKPGPNCPAATSAAPFVPPTRDLPALRRAATGCQGCPLYCNATQVVFGEGPSDASVMFVGVLKTDSPHRWL